MRRKITRSIFNRVRGERVKKKKERIINRMENLIEKLSLWKKRKRPMTKRFHRVRK